MPVTGQIQFRAFLKDNEKLWNGECKRKCTELLRQNFGKMPIKSFAQWSNGLKPTGYNVGVFTVDRSASKVPYIQGMDYKQFTQDKYKQWNWDENDDQNKITVEEFMKTPYRRYQRQKKALNEDLNLAYTYGDAVPDAGFKDAWQKSFTTPSVVNVSRQVSARTSAASSRLPSRFTSTDPSRYTTDIEDL